MREQTVKLVKVRETKRTILFEEQPIGGQAPLITNIYVQKWFAQDATEVEVTVKVND